MAGIAHKKPGGAQAAKFSQYGFISLFFCFFLVSVPVTLFANDSLVRDTGSAIVPISTDKIRMVSERVTVTLKRRPKVRCEFLFENTTDEEITAKVGFPSLEGFNPLGVVGNSPFSDFVAYVDGKQTPVMLRSEQVTETSMEWNQGEERFWYVWDVTFPPNQTLRIINEYETDTFHRGYVPQFQYILTTGANWKGTIEHAIIEVKAGSRKNLWDNLSKAEPKGYTVDGDTITWEFHDFEPDFNINIYWRTMGYTLQQTLLRIASGSLKKDYEGDKRLYDKSDLEITIPEKTRQYLLSDKGNFTPEDYLFSELERMYLRLLRNEIFARHGKIFESRDLKWFFKEYKNYLGWYQPDETFTPDRLNEFERKNVRFILAREKEKGWR
jgi:hypothetical protein